MVDRIVVLAKSDDASSTGSTRRLLALWIAAPIVLAYLLGIHEVMTKAMKYPFETLQSTATGITVLAALCLLVLSALRSSVSSQLKLSRGVSVSMYHIGVQLATVWVSKDSDNSIVQECNPRFIPRDQIIDCVVTEVVLAHRIQSVVVLRLQKNINGQAAIKASSRHRQDDSIQLVNAFSGVDLNYSECAVIRSRIKAYLDHKDSIVQHN